MEKREHFNELPGFEGEMSVQFDVESGRVRSYGDGFWSPRQATAFFKDWKQIIRRVHDAGHAVSALVDMSDSNVQTAEVVDIIAKGAGGLYRGADAIAMLVPNSMAKMQMRRALDPDFHNYFISRSAAETWLMGKRLIGGETLRLAVGRF